MPIDYQIQLINFPFFILSVFTAEKPGKPHKYAIFFTLNWKLYFFLEIIFPRFFVTDFVTEFVTEMVQYSLIL